MTVRRGVTKAHTTIDMVGTWRPTVHNTPRQWQPEEITHCRQVLQAWGVGAEVIDALGLTVTPDGPADLTWMIADVTDINGRVKSAHRRHRKRSLDGGERLEEEQGTGRVDQQLGTVDVHREDPRAPTRRRRGGK